MKVALIGAANPETMRMISALRRAASDFDVTAFVDNDTAKHGKSFHGIPIVGGMDCIASLASAGVLFVNLITGSTSIRYAVTLDAVKRGAALTNFIHPSINLEMTTLGLGNYVQEGVIMQAEVSVGDNSSIHMGSLIGHESRIGNSVFIAHGVSVSGCCSIEDGCFIGTHATVLPRVTIGKWSIVGAGAVVTKDIPPYSVVVGNPARFLRKNEVQHADGRVIL